MINLSTARRQSWTPMTGTPCWLLLPLPGIPPRVAFGHPGRQAAA